MMDDDGELTRAQLRRQDEVDNAILELARSLAPEGAAVEWDAEMIYSIRDKLEYWLCERLGVMSDMEFYPYLEDEVED